MQSTAARSEGWSIGLFGSALFLSAALLFLVQPMFAKALLPLLGGAPAVWNTCVVFFELILLAGYLYAYFLQRWAKPAVQVGVHLALVLSVLMFLPLRVHAPFPPPTSVTAVVWLLATLFLSLGVPLLVLSATSPLLQSWFGNISHRRSQDPYFLYAASNAGSMLGLLSYPFVIEPLVGLHTQSWIWSLGYFGLVACLAVAGIVLYRSAGSAGDDSPAAPVTETITLGRKAKWVLLAFIPSSLMLSVTTYISTTIAPMPLLWVVPLALYLLTLVIAFSAGSDQRLARLRRYAPYIFVVVIIVMSAQVTWWEPLLFVIHLAAFFVIALTCHSLLAADRPSKEHLTEFYLWLATGGALGGIFTAILAPLVFRTVVEYPLILILAAFFLRDPAQGSTPSRTWDLWLPAALGGALAVFISLEARYAPHELVLKVTLAFVVAGLIAAVSFKRPWGFAVSIAALLLCSVLFSATIEDRLYVERNFFGINSVLSLGPFHILSHGPTVHGIENMVADKRDIPLTYYARTGPLGDIFSRLKPLKNGQIATVGLGTALCFHTPQQRWTIYEIDPAVDRIARDQSLFEYVADCAPDTPTVLGDARLSLQRAPDNTYDLIILDAYSADYIPVHLLTQEALALYNQKMTDSGVLAFHITNNWFDLEPPLTSLAQSLGLSCFVKHDKYLWINQARAGKYRSDWLVMARRADVLTPLVQQDRQWERCPPSTFRVWTDDYSSLVTAIPVHFSIGPK
jgi:hypothetical protein